jgi:hypothetical protein
VPSEESAILELEKLIVPTGVVEVEEGEWLC